MDPVCWERSAIKNHGSNAEYYADPKVKQTARFVEALAAFGLRVPPRLFLRDRRAGKRTVIIHVMPCQPSDPARPSPQERQPLERLLAIGSDDSGQSRRVADFLLAIHNAPQNGGWDPLDLWAVDAEIGDDMLSVLLLLRACRTDFGALGYKPQIAALWRSWRRLAPISSAAQGSEEGDPADAQF